MKCITDTDGRKAKSLEFLSVRNMTFLFESLKDKHSNCIFESQGYRKYICKKERQLNIPAEPTVSVTGNFLDGSYRIKQ